MTCASPCPFLQGGIPGRAGAAKGQLCRMHLGSGCWGVAALTHMEGAAFTAKPGLQQRGARGGTMEQGSALHREQLPSSSSPQPSLWLL